MASLNKVHLIGRLGADPEIKFTETGKSVATFNLATSESWKGEGGKKVKTTWHKIKAWGKLAEICGEYLSKGMSIYLEGKIENRKYTEDGITKYFSEVIMLSMQMLTPKKDGERDGESADSGGGDDGDIPQDDIPF